MKYQFDSMVRFSEIGEDQHMTLNAILNYYQDSCNFQSAAVGLGVDELTAKKRVWLLTSWQICVNRYPVMGEKIEVSTWAYDFRGFYGLRNFTMHTKQGELLSCANSVWVYFDTEKGRPEKVDQETADAYGIDSKFPMKYAPRKVAVPENAVEMEGFTVHRHQVDVNHHLNNGQYILMAQDCLPADFKIREMRAEYKKQAKLGSRLTPMVHREGAACSVVLRGEDKSPYAVVHFDGDSM